MQSVDVFLSLYNITPLNTNIYLSIRRSLNIKKPAILKFEEV